MRRALASTALLAVAGTAGDCANSIDEVKYTVAGPGRAHVTYFDNSGIQRQRTNVSLPWTYKANLYKDRITLGVGAIGQGRLVCRILINNNEVARSSRIGDCRVAEAYRKTQRAEQ